MIIESCCTTLDETLAAQSRGADRIELCTDLSCGGLTPPRDLIREVVNQLSIPVNVLIRPFTHDALWQSLPNRLAPLDPSQAELGPLPLTVPRVAWVCEALPPVQDSCVKEKNSFGFTSGDFIYTDDEIHQMMDDIDYCKTVGAAGIVVGALTPEGIVDLPAMRHLIAAARPLSVTFHRAFDVCTEDPFTALDKIISLGCDRLLTSGQAPAAWEGRSRLRLLVRRASGRLIVMPGGGVTPDNLSDLAAFTLAQEFHGTRIP